VILQSMGR